MRRLALPLLALLAAVPARGARDAPLTAPAAPTPSVAGRPVPGMPAVTAPGLTGPAASLPLQPMGADLRLDPAVQAAMANPVPVTAMGLRPEYFTIQAGQAQAAAPNALSAGRALAAGATPGPSLETRSARVYDGQEAAPAAASARGAVDTRGPPAARSDYLGRARSLSGAALLRELHDVSGHGFRPLDYKSAHRALFATVDRVTVGGRSGVRDAYSGVFVPGRSADGRDYPEPGDANDDGFHDTAMNVEHVWPEGFFNKRLPMRSDLHHLMATFDHDNGVRSNLPFGVVRGEPEYQNSGGAKMGGGFFEPPDAAKGRVARATLYFYVRYFDLGIAKGQRQRRFWNAQLETLLDWNRRFPPSAEELQRNALVEIEQGNRNPFVDDPGLADRIGADVFRR